MATVFLLTVGFVGIVMLGMSVGVALSGRCLRGSCGGQPDAEACLCKDKMQ